MAGSTDLSRRLAGVSTYGFAWLFGPLITGVTSGVVLSGLGGPLSPQRSIQLGYAFGMVGALLNLLLAAHAPRSVPWHVLPLFVFTMDTSVAMPRLTLLLLDLFPAMRGLVPSLAGFMQFTFPGFNAATIAPFLSQSLVSLAPGMATLTVASMVLWVLRASKTVRFHRFAIGAKQIKEFSQVPASMDLLSPLTA